MIDLTHVRSALKDITELVDDLDGTDLDDVDDTRDKAAERSRKAQVSRDLLLLQHRFEMAGTLAMNEYWFAKGEVDVLDSERTP